MIFIAFGAALIFITEKSITVSNALCGEHQQCAVYAYRWLGASPTCPCLALIDVERIPRTMEEWMNPLDITSTAELLAASGDLKVVHVINRGLPRVPEKLRRCQKLQYLSLIYTGLEEIPSWTKDFQALQALHIEGKELFTNLVTIPDDLFSDMPRLTYLQIAVHDNLVKLPTFTGVPRLQRILLAHMLHLETLPSLDKMPGLRRLDLVYLPQVQALPDLSNLKYLVEFIVFRRTAFCCNGFLGACDPTDSMCEANPSIGIPKINCLSPSAPRTTNESLAVVDKFHDSVCMVASDLDSVNSTDMLTTTAIEACDGVLFRKCEYPPGSGQLGICYNNRMQVIACIIDPNYIRLREAHIAAGIGQSCDPIEEAWLGCK